MIESINSSEGFEDANKNVPDLIIADTMMPVMNGLELTRLLKNNELTSHIPVILLKAKSSEASKLEGLDTQADDYITMPFNVKELKSRIMNLIANRQKLRVKFSRIVTVNLTEIAATSIDERFLQKALMLVEKNLAEADYTIDMFCGELNMSRI